MPLHLFPFMAAALAFMLWLAFQSDDETELLGAAGEGEDRT